MSTVRDLVVGGAGAAASVGCARWAAAISGQGAGTVDELVAIAAAGLAATLGAWYAITAVVLLAARVVSWASPGPAAAALGRAAGRWGAPLLRRTAAAAVGAGLVLGVPPAWASVHDAPPASIARMEDVPLDLRPGFGAAPEEPVRSTYVVEPGDSLWSITAASLGAGATDAQIAAEWPRWYRTNRAVVGADPNLIHPGQQLLAPEPKDDP